MKACPRCGSWSNGFYVNRRAKDGLTRHCKECTKAAVAKAQSRMTPAQRDEFRAKQKRWRERNPDRQRALERRWQALNPERWAMLVRCSAASRRAREMAAEGSFGAGDVARILGLQRNRCAICACDLNEHKYHVDHVVPLSRGGSNAPTNLQLLCAPCNMKKYDRDPIQHARSMGRLL